MVNNFWKAIAAFVAMAETRQLVLPKELNTTNINRKGAAPHRRIGLPLNSCLCNCKSSHHFTSAISYHCDSVPSSSQISVLTIIFGKILYEHLPVMI